MTEGNKSRRPVRVVVLGAAGRMGEEIIAQLRREEGCEVYAAVARPGHPRVGLPASPDLPDLAVTADLRRALEGADVMVDFTRPEFTIEALGLAAELGVAAVVGTTGLDAAQKATLGARACTVPVVFSPNMSVGVNVMLALLRVAVEAMGDGFDLELFEAHHRHKIDAPSGTALRMLEVLAEARGWDLDEVVNHERNGKTGARPDKQIGVQVMRGGDVAGEHTVFLLGDGERLEITHRASSRKVFATGAVRAALWIAGQPPGLYGMNEVLSL